MLYQIIFFTALILFIILFIRRMSSGKVVGQRIASNAANIGKTLVAKTSSMGKGFISLAKKTKDNIPLITDKKDVSPQFRSATDHNFWQEESIQNKPELSGYFEEGDALFKKGKYQEAEDFFLKAATRSPGNPQVYARLGVIYLHQKNFSDAIESLKVAVKLDTHNPSRHYNLALAYLGNNDNQKALSSTREAISLDPVTKKYRLLLEQLLEGKVEDTVEK